MKNYALGPVRKHPYDGRRVWSDKYGYVHLQGNKWYRCLFDGTDRKYGREVAADIALIINEACAEARADGFRAGQRSADRRAAREVHNWRRGEGITSLKLRILQRPKKKRGG